MAHNDLLALQQKLGQLFQSIQSGNTGSVIPELKKLLRQWPSNADVCHLAALAYKGESRLELAVDYFKRSLALREPQPQVHNNLANLLKSRSEYSAAEKHYRRAIELQPNYIEAHRNLALCHYAEGNFVQAEEQLLEALKLKPADKVALTALANCRREMDQFASAKNAYRQVIGIDAGYANAWYNLGLTHHLDKELDDAISCYRQAYKLSGTNEMLLSLAATLHEVGRTGEANKVLSAQIEKKPGSIELHERLNEMLWESDLRPQYGVSYQQAIVKAPEAEELRLSYASQLLMVGEFQRAQAQLDKTRDLFESSSGQLALQAKLHAQRLQYQPAYECFSKALDLNFSVDLAQQMIKLCIILERYSDAQMWLDRVFDLRPECQLTWGMQGLVWRLTNDDRADWLNNYEQFVGVYHLPVPAGYSSIGDFLSSLNEVLVTKHVSKNAPLRQTLKFGTQTPPRLLHDSTKQIQELKTSLTALVSQYIAELPDDIEHPFLKRKSESFEFSGSWSVKLKPQGFHINHVHPEGWISSSCYISLPGSMHDKPLGLDGKIKFGESPLSLGEREQVAKTVTPKEGVVVLFPSYFWHGTYPFDGDDSDYRLTAPFDVLPT